MARNVVETAPTEPVTNAALFIDLSVKADVPKSDAGLKSGTVQYRFDVPDFL